MKHNHEPGYRPDLVTYLRHIVDDHGIEETGTLWKSDRETFDRIHARCELIELHAPIAGPMIGQKSCGHDKAPWPCRTWKLLQAAFGNQL